MLQEPFEILGYWENNIFFRLAGKIIVLDKRLPKEDLILYLKVEPEDCKELKNEILYQASSHPLTFDSMKELMKEST
jgi:hypothetical protein